MSLNQFYDLFKRGRIEANDKGLSLPDGAGYLLAWGITVPSDDATGYAPSCLFLHTDGSGEDTLYVNTGTVASANFDSYEIGLEAALTASGGAAKIGVADSAGYLSATTVETALAELVDTRGARNAVLMAASRTSTNRLTVEEMRQGQVVSITSALGVDLATPASSDVGLQFNLITAVTSGAMSCTTQGSETINGAAAHISCDAVGDNISLLWTGTNWFLSTKEIA